MPNFFVIKDNKIINHIVGDSLDDIKEIFTDCIVEEEDGIRGKNWEVIDGEWRPPYPQDGQKYYWNPELFIWNLVNPIIIEE